MQNNPASIPRTFMALMALLGWLALLAQFYINVSLKQNPLAEIIIRYFSYFTILTNLMVATCYTALLLAPSSATARFFSRQQTLAVIPVLALILWLLYAGKNKLQWKDTLPWLIYPLAYIIYILLRGSISGFYPYPFIDKTVLGMNTVLVNAAWITLLFIVISLVFVALGKAISKRQRQ